MREEDLAKDLKLHTKQLRRTLRFFEEEKLITRDHRKEVGFMLYCYKDDLFGGLELSLLVNFTLSSCISFRPSVSDFRYLKQHCLFP